ncbi:MAG: hypothetical protein OHK0047_33880 [Leptolyngbyaceae cyanobacterium]
MTQTIAAATLFRSAYENRYTWDRTFPGFSAIAHSEQDGTVHQAYDTVSSDLKISRTNVSSSEAITINVLSTMDTDEGYLPVDYESFYSDPNTGEISSPKQRHHDKYARFGDFFILTARSVHLADHADEAETQELRLTNISLLTPDGSENNG